MSDYPLSDSEKEELTDYHAVMKLAAELSRAYLSYLRARQDDAETDEALARGLSIVRTHVTL